MESQVKQSKGHLKQRVFEIYVLVGQFPKHLPAESVKLAEQLEQLVADEQFKHPTEQLPAILLLDS